MNFDEIYARYFESVYKFIYSMCRSRATAEDITQETFLRAMEKIDDFRGQCKLQVWLCQIAKNLYFTHYVREKRITPNEDRHLAHGDGPEGMLLDRDDALRIHRALHRIEDPYKEVFSLRVFGELSFAQIGDLFEKSETWARVTYHRARLKIKEEFT